MTATISPEIVQLALGLGNLISAQWLAIRGLSGQATMEDIEMFARKGVFSSIGRASTAATIVAVALTAFEPSMAFAGAAPNKGVTATNGTSTATDFSCRRCLPALFGDQLHRGLQQSATRYLEALGLGQPPGWGRHTCILDARQLT